MPSAIDRGEVQLVNCCVWGTLYIVERRFDASTLRRFDAELRLSKWVAQGVSAGLNRHRNSRS